MKRRNILGLVACGLVGAGALGALALGLDTANAAHHKGKSGTFAALLKKRVTPRTKLAEANEALALFGL